MRGILWVLLFLLGVAGVVTPVIYLYVASNLPPLETEFDLEGQLRHYIEGERISHQMGQARPEHERKFSRPDFTLLPKELVALFISRLGCPTFFQTPREEGLAWGWRLTNALVFGRQPKGDGWCEHYLAVDIAQSVGVTGDLPRAVAANKVHAFLQKDQLVAYHLASLRFDRGVVGVSDAAWALFRKQLPELSLAELAELMLAFDYYEDIRTCRNASLIRRNRDYLLQVLIAQGLVPEERGKGAQATPVFCQTKR